MPKTLEQLRLEYRRKWGVMIINPSRIAEIDKHIKGKILSNQSRYQAVSGATKVPWFVIAAIHSMESDCDFKTHLHNGDPLSAKTVHVPAGRPTSHDAPFTWEESAIDALGYDHMAGETDWSIEAILYRLEAYNGWGYLNRGINSPYLFSFSDQYKKGLYVSDGKWSDTAVSEQIGAAVLLKRMYETKAISGIIPEGFVNIVEGDRGDRVLSMQRMLLAHGFDPSKLDRIFGPKTKRALLDFQEAAHHQYYTQIKPTGICDSYTWQALKELLPGTLKPAPTPVPTPVPGPIFGIGDDYLGFYHLKDIVPDLGLDVDWNLFRELGTKIVCASKSVFSSVCAGAEKTDYGSAQCAITTAAILEKEFLMAGEREIASMFNSELRAHDKFALTHQVEIMLRRLNWLYYFQKDFIAPLGAIGMMSCRYNFAGCTQHSGHIFSILADRYPEHNLIADNGGFSYVYANVTEGFWCPPTWVVTAR